MILPPGMKPLAEQLRRDFGNVTTRWLEDGEIDAQDVAHMRAVLNELVGNPGLIDGDTQVERLRCIAATWREIAERTPRPWLSPYENELSVRHMVLEVKRS